MIVYYLKKEIECLPKSHGFQTECNSHNVFLKLCIFLRYLPYCSWKCDVFINICSLFGGKIEWMITNIFQTISLYFHHNTRNLALFFLLFLHLLFLYAILSLSLLYYYQYSKLQSSKRMLSLKYQEHNTWKKYLDLENSLQVFGLFST